jgi:hypothetical protein
VKGCHAGLDPASIPVMDSRFRGKDRIGIYCCRSNNRKSRLNFAPAIRSFFLNYRLTSVLFCFNVGVLFFGRPENDYY